MALVFLEPSSDYGHVTSYLHTWTGEGWSITSSALPRVSELYSNYPGKYLIRMSYFYKLMCDLAWGTGSFWSLEEISRKFKYIWTGTNVDNEFKLKVLRICKKLQLDPDDLMTVMAFESMGFDPQASYAGAVGLIQFIPNTAIKLGTTTSALRNMSIIDQLDYVEKYFENSIRDYGILSNLGDVYLAVFWPPGIKKSDSYVIAVKDGTNSGVYSWNKSLDFNNDGVLTRRDTIDRLTNYRSINYRVNNSYSGA